MFRSNKPKVLIYTGHNELLGGDAHYAFGLINKLDAMGVDVEVLTDRNRLFEERAKAWLSAKVLIRYLATRPVLFSPNFVARCYSTLDQQKEMLRGYRRWLHFVLSLPIYSRKCYVYLMFLVGFLSMTYIRNDLVNFFVFYNVFRKKKGTVDIFHFNNGGFPAKTAGIFSLMVARFFGVKCIVMTVHNIPRSRLTPMDLFYDLIVRTCCVKVIAASDRVRQEMVRKRKIPGSMIQTIRCGLEDLSALGPSKCSVKREDMGIEPNQPLLLIAGNFEEERKGHVPLLEALAMVKPKFPKVLLMIVGAGSEGRKRKLESIIDRLELSDQVLFLGYRQDIYELNSIADICLTPSTGNESIPYTIIEAARLAKPVITTTAGGCGEAVEDGVTGYVVEPNNPLRLAEKIEALLENEELRKKMGAAAKSLFLERFLLDKRIEDHLVVYDGCLDNDSN